jgi:purine-nucleoside phosphorylase
MKYNYDIEYFKKSSDYIFSKTGYQIDVALILGSALGSLAEEIKNPIEIDYKDIPNFLHSTVKSHAGKLIIGDLGGKKVVCMSGRFHYYEGYDFEQLVIPIRVFKLLGVETVILTNAAGAVNTSYGASPLRGKNIEEFGPRFFDVSDMYTKELRELAKECADNISLKINEGVYYFCSGPQFETPAEINAIRILGGDAAGMSTVTEALTAAHCKMKVLGLSLMTNMAAGVLDEPLTTAEVAETGEKAAKRFKELLREIIKELN